MAFESLRKDKPARSSKCLYCGKNEKDGTVQIAVKDKDTKTVVSRTVGACESCAVKTYEAALKTVNPPATAAS